MRKKASLASVDAAILPSVDEILNTDQAAKLTEVLGRDRVLAIVRSLMAQKRAQLFAGELPETDRPTLVKHLAAGLAESGAAEQLRGVRRVINATGVVIHTNLGRAPLSDRAKAAMNEAAGYSTIEYDLTTGSRGPRGEQVVSLIKLLTGAEDALAVNNCAAAALLVLSVFAAGREVIVSRGELVEIGGDFRIPDILSRTGAVLREVGTTNRTHLKDYENAISGQTAMILKVHPSNFRISGFTKSPTTAELVNLARERGLIFYEDAGSGALVDAEAIGISGEPVISNVIASGADLVSFSGDKLLGGPQAGIITGRSGMIEKLRRDPFYRALRLDKTITAALEATLDAYARDSARNEVPVLAMLSASNEQLAARAERFSHALGEKLGEGSALEINLAKGVSAVGGGAGPDAPLETTLLALTHPGLTETELEQILRSATPPIIVRIEGGRVLIDLRTVSESDEATMLDTVAGIFRDQAAFVQTHLDS